MSSSHLFFWLPLLLAPFTVPCRLVFAMPEDLEMWPYQLSFRVFFFFFYHGKENIMHSSCFLDSVANLLVRHMVFVGNVQKSPMASHLKGLDPSLDVFRLRAHVILLVLCVGSYCFVCTSHQPYRAWPHRMKIVLWKRVDLDSLKSSSVRSFKDVELQGANMHFEDTQRVKGS